MKAIVIEIAITSEATITTTKPVELQ